MINIPAQLTQQITDILACTSPELLENPTESTRPRVLVGTIRYHYIGSAVDVVLAHALRLHGARVDVLLCDQLMPACDHRNIDTDTPAECMMCQHNVQTLFSAAELPVHYLSTFLDGTFLSDLEDQVAALPRKALLHVEHLGVQVGQIAYTSTLRYFLRGRLLEDEHWSKLREFLVTAIFMAEISRNLIEQLQPDALVISHGIYVTWGVLADYARQHGVRVTVYGYGYRQNSLLVSQGITYHHDLLVEPVSTWRAHPLTSSQREEITHYLRSRVNGALDWISYSPNPEVNRQTIVNTMGLDTSKPTIGMFTNLAWDAAVLFRGAAFPDMTSWVLQTIQWAIDRLDLQLIVRCHPAEVKRKSMTREKIADVIRTEFPDLPSHIKIIPAESELSTYTLSELIDLTVVYSSKVGLEFAARGLPVVVAGEAFYRGKGFTYDPPTETEYFDLLHQVRKQKGEEKMTIHHPLPSLSPLDSASELALTYAYHYFFRRHVTLNYFADHGMGKSITHFKFSSLTPLTPGKNMALDRFCKAVIHGSN
jgi:hypothetical protein